MIKLRAAACPGCGNKGKGLKAITLKSLLSASALDEAGDLDAYRHCPAPGCDVAYFQPATGRTLSKDAVPVRIGTKETEGPRPVCYCFSHSWESIEDELRASGTTDVIETITAHCKNGDDRCPETNPQGSCCLGNVRRAVKEGKAKLNIVDQPRAPATAPAQADVPDCCAPSAEQEAVDDCCAVDDVALAPVGDGLPRPAVAERSGMLAAVGGLTAAVLSSACCWLPLLLIGVGAGTTSVAGFFEEYRMFLLAGTAGLLGAGFYFVYFRKEKCAPGSACEVPNPRLKRFNKITLWVAAGFAAVFAFFPNYIGTVLDLTRTDAQITAVSMSTAVSATFAVEGMTCEACTVHIKKAVATLPGATATVSFTSKTATVARTNPSVSDAMVVAAIAEAGYRAAPVGGQVHRFDVEGMTCESCAEGIEHAVGNVSGVGSVAVSFAEQLTVVVAAEGATLSDAVVLGSIAEAGYKATAAE